MNVLYKQPLFQYCGITRLLWCEQMITHCVCVCVRVCPHNNTDELELGSLSISVYYVSII